MQLDLSVRALGNDATASRLYGMIAGILILSANGFDRKNGGHDDKLMRGFLFWWMGVIGYENLEGREKEMILLRPVTN